MMMMRRRRRIEDVGEDEEDDGNEDYGDKNQKPEVEDEEKLESGGEVGKGGVDRVSHLSWVCVGIFHLSWVYGNLSYMMIKQQDGSWVCGKFSQHD